MNPQRRPLVDVGELDRTTYIGGGDAAAIMGVGAVYQGVQQTPLTVYMKKIGEAPELSEADELFLKRRKRFEEPIVAMLREEFDGNIVGKNRRYRDPEYPFICAELDWEWADHDGILNAGETKTVIPFAFGEAHGWGEPGTSDYPVNYVCQNMLGLGVTGWDTCTVAALVGLDNMLFYRLERDEEVITEIRTRMADFWLNHVVPRIPPEPINLDDCMALALKLRGKPVEVDDQLADRLEQLRIIRATDKANEIAANQIKFEILDYIRKAWSISGDADPKDDAMLMRNGVKIASYNKQTTNRLDVKRLRDEKPDIALAYSKPTDSRVLRISKP